MSTGNSVYCCRKITEWFLLVAPWPALSAGVVRKCIVNQYFKTGMEMRTGARSLKGAIPMALKMLSATGRFIVNSKTFYVDFVLIYFFRKYKVF